MILNIIEVVVSDYENKKDQVECLKAGILLEAGFDTVAPNKEITISSWPSTEFPLAEQPI